MAEVSSVFVSNNGEVLHDLGVAKNNTLGCFKLTGNYVLSTCLLDDWGAKLYLIDAEEAGDIQTPAQAQPHMTRDHHLATILPWMTYKINSSIGGEVAGELVFTHKIPASDIEITRDPQTGEVYFPYNDYGEAAFVDLGSIKDGSAGKQL